MAKLYFRYGAMGASKTANALMVAYNYEEKGLTPLVLKPRIDTRDGEKIIKSRIGLQRPCEYVEDFLGSKTNVLPWKEIKKRVKDYDCIIVDECQFMTKDQVTILAAIVENMDIPVLCYGLSTDFQQNFFPASKTLFDVADVVEEIKTICWCGDGAKCNARLDTLGNVVKKGSQIQLGGTETGLPTYTSLCEKHFEEGNIGEKLRGVFEKYNENTFWEEDFPRKTM